MTVSWPHKIVFDEIRMYNVVVEWSKGVGELEGLVRGDLPDNFATLIDGQPPARDNMDVARGLSKVASFLTALTSPHIFKSAFAT